MMRSGNGKESLQDSLKFNYLKLIKDIRIHLISFVTNSFQKMFISSMECYQNSISISKINSL